MRVSVLLPNIEVVIDPKNDLDVNGANLALWIQLTTYANHPAFEGLELFLSPKDFAFPEKIQRFGAALVYPENRGKGRLEIHPIHALGDIWLDAQPRILHTDDLWALSRDRQLRDTFAKGPIAHICDTHCLGHFGLHRSLREVTSLDRVDGDTIIACSHALASTLSEGYDLPYEIRSCPRRIDAKGLNPATSAEKQALRRKLGLPEDLTLGLFLGRVTAAMKGELMLLIDALVGNLGGLVISGVSNMDGYPEALRAYAEERGVSERVFLFGRFSPSERGDWYRACDMFLFPGDCINEAFGQTTIEALACGLPVIQSAWDGLKDTLNSKSGSLIPTCAAPVPERLGALSVALETPTQFLALAQGTVVDREAWFAAHQHWMGDVNAQEAGSRAARALFESEFLPEVVEERFVEILRESLEAAISGGRAYRDAKAGTLSVDYSLALKHYSSVAWNPQIHFEETDRGRSWRRGGQAPMIYPEMETMLDLGLFAAIQERSAMGAVSAKMLGQRLAGPTTTENDVYFHAMFLAKQGFLKLIPPTI